MSGLFKPYFELYSPVRNDTPNFHRRWRFALRISAVQNWLKTQPKNLSFLTELKKKLLKRWNRCVEVEKGLHWKVILLSLLYIYNKCALFFKSPFTYWLTLVFSPPIQCVPGDFFLGVKRPGRETDHSPPSSAEVKNAWSYTSTPPIRLHGVVLS
jgi:hypothetical protein